MTEPRLRIAIEGALRDRWTIWVDSPAPLDVQRLVRALVTILGDEEVYILPTPAPGETRRARAGRDASWDRVRRLRDDAARQRRTRTRDRR